VRDLGLVVFSACSHAGIVNVCTHTRNLFPDIPIYCVMGGLHLGGVMEAIIPDTVEALRQFRIRHIISGHCTGWRALHALANAFRRQREPVGGRHELHFRCRRAAPSEAVRPAMKLVSGQPHGALPDGQDRLPVTVVTGFLGSGKTTLLNHILTSQRGLKVAVIVNEIGEIGIDGELIIATGDDMVELSNGCICCSLNNDLAGAGRRVLARREKIDHLLVETSGVADPLPIVLTFLRPEFRNRMRIDSIVSIADAESFSLDLFASRPARNQFVYADVMLLNKCDLVGADRVGSVEEQIRNVADRARIVRTTRCRVPLPLILSAGLFQSDRYLTALTDPVPDGDRHRHDEAGRPHLVDDGFESISFAADRPFAVDKFQRFLEQLPDNVFRAKGILWIDESDRRWVFHLVGKRFTLDESGAASPMRNRLVLIGRNLDRALLREELANCLI